jgi:hypothetical protein
MLTLTDETALELGNLGMVGLTLKLMNQQEYSVQFHASRLFKNITQRIAVLGRII